MDFLVAVLVSNSAMVATMARTEELAMIKHPAELRSHAINLARAFDIHLMEQTIERSKDMQWIAQHVAPRFNVTPAEFLHNVGSAADPNTRQVFGAYIDNEFTYALALHEIGHLAHPGGYYPVENPSSALEYEMELNAWEFAQYHALIWTPKMEAAKKFGLYSYRAKIEDERIAA